MNIKEYHPSIYQLLVQQSIEDKIIDKTIKEEFTDKQFRELYRNYLQRVHNLTSSIINWEEHYTKIMCRAYKGAIENREHKRF